MKETPRRIETVELHEGLPKELVLILQITRRQTIFDPIGDALGIAVDELDIRLMGLNLDLQEHRRRFGLENLIEGQPQGWPMRL